LRGGRVAWPHDLLGNCTLNPVSLLIHWCFRDRSYENVSPKVKAGLTYQVFYGHAKALNLGKEFVAATWQMVEAGVARGAA
jgi:hypothetical protein